MHDGTHSLYSDTHCPSLSPKSRHGLTCERLRSAGRCYGGNSSAPGDDIIHRIGQFTQLAANYTEFLKVPVRSQRMLLTRFYSSGWSQRCMLLTRFQSG